MTEDKSIVPIVNEGQQMNAWQRAKRRLVPSIAVRRNEELRSETLLQSLLVKAMSDLIDYGIVTEYEYSHRPEETHFVTDYSVKETTDDFDYDIELSAKKVMKSGEVKARVVSFHFGCFDKEKNGGKTFLVIIGQEDGYLNPSKIPVVEAYQFGDKFNYLNGKEKNDFLQDILAAQVDSEATQKEFDRIDKNGKNVNWNNGAPMVVFD